MEGIRIKAVIAKSRIQLWVYFLFLTFVPEIKIFLKSFGLYCKAQLIQQKMIDY